MTSSKKKLKKYLKKAGTMASWGAIALFPVGVAQILKGDYLPGMLALMVAALASPRTLVPFVLAIALEGEKLLGWVLVAGLTCAAAVLYIRGDAVRATSLILLCVPICPIAPLPRGFGGEWLSRQENRLLATILVGIAVLFGLPYD